VLLQCSILAILICMLWYFIMALIFISLWLVMLNIFSCDDLSFVYSLWWNVTNFLSLVHFLIGLFWWFCIKFWESRYILNNGLLSDIWFTLGIFVLVCISIPYSFLSMYAYNLEPTTHNVDFCRYINFDIILCMLIKNLYKFLRGIVLTSCISLTIGNLQMWHVSPFV
jgi:hypothetical protein